MQRYENITTGHKLLFSGEASNRGFGMIETLVALAIVAIGLVALTQMSIGGLRTSTAASNQMIANDAATMLIERMRANSSSAAANGSYNWNATNACPVSGVVDCGGSTATCTFSQMATYDLSEAICGNTLLTRLPGSESVTSVCGAYGDSRAICTITVSWFSMINDATQTHTLGGIVL